MNCQTRFLLNIYSIVINKTELALDWLSWGLCQKSDAMSSHDYHLLVQLPTSCDSSCTCSGTLNHRPSLWLLLNDSNWQMPTNFHWWYLPAYCSCLPCTSGVFLGSILSPLLFIVCINDLLQFIASSTVSPLLYTDDCRCLDSISCPSDCLLRQEDLATLHTWSNTWKLIQSWMVCTLQLPLTTKT